MNQSTPSPVGELSFDAAMALLQSSVSVSIRPLSEADLEREMLVGDQVQS